ncbi:MAG: hypothetical protein QNJ94_18640 [Alphaproteobacteria bacterium]|nr:hypothetical protein [Alphaproteobacteria bacterium]
MEITLLNVTSIEIGRLKRIEAVGSFWSRKIIIRTNHGDLEIDINAPFGVTDPAGVEPVFTHETAPSRLVREFVDA